MSRIADLLRPPLWRFTIGLFILLSVVVALSLISNNSAETSKIGFMSSACLPNGDWHRVHPATDDPRPLEQGGWFMGGRSAIGTQVCTPGTLRIRAKAESANGDPAVTVMLNGRVLTTELVNREEEVTVKVPSAGNLQVAYLNDYYRADVRSAELRRIRLDISRCRILLPDLPLRNPRNAYVRASELLALMEPEPITFRPCGDGVLSFVLIGYEGGGAQGIIEVKQEGKVVAKITAPQKSQVFSMPVTAQPLTITFINPYARQLADRNLILESFIWKPLIRDSVP